MSKFEINNSINNAISRIWLLLFSWFFNSLNRKKFYFILSFIFIIEIFYFGKVNAVILLREDFEYGKTASNLAACEALPGFTQKWNNYNEEDDGDRIQITDARAHGGNYSCKISVMGLGNDTFLDATYNFGYDVYMDYWIYPDSSSRAGNNNKLIYSYNGETGLSVWCIKINTQERALGSCTYDVAPQNAGWHLDYLGQGCATSYTGLSNLQEGYLLVEQWNRMIIRICYISSTETLGEAWIDNGNGLRKVASVSITDPECRWWESRGSCGRIKFGLMTDSTLIYYFDDVILATSSEDIDWGGSVPPPRNDLPPSMVTNFAATQEDGQVVLSWTNPDDSDFIGTLIRYRTDGIYPITYEDGISVCNRQAVPGSRDSFIHEGLINGTTYSYSAFTYDGGPNYSQGAHIESTPNPGAPPSQDRVVIIKDDFNTDNLDQWCKDGCGPTNPTYAYIANDYVYEGSHSFKEVTPPGLENGGRIKHDFSNNPQRKLYAKWYYRCSDGWNPEHTNKIIQLMAGNAASPTQADLQMIVQIAHYQGSRLGQFMVCYSNNIGGQVIYHNLHQNVNSPYIIRETGRFYKLELEVDAGTPRNNDGSVKLWINDVLKCDYENLELLPGNYNEDPKFWWLIVCNLSESVNYERISWYDDFILSTTKPSPQTIHLRLLLPVENFIAERIDENQIILQWRNPRYDYFAGTKILYSTSGSYPTDPKVSDNVVCIKPALPGSNDSYIHTVNNGATYYYSAFSYNEFFDFSLGVNTSVSLP